MHGKGREEIWFGIVLVGFGTWLLLARLHVLEVRHYWTWCGLLPIGFGLASVGAWRSAKAVATGVSLGLFGLWFLMSANGWWGLDWARSWPMVLVAIGAELVVRSLLEPFFTAPEGDVAGGGETHAR